MLENGEIDSQTQRLFFGGKLLRKLLNFVPLMIDIVPVFVNLQKSIIIYVCCLEVNGHYFSLVIRKNMVG